MLRLKVTEQGRTSSSDIAAVTESSVSTAESGNIDEEATGLGGRFRGRPLRFFAGCSGGGDADDCGLNERLRVVAGASSVSTATEVDDDLLRILSASAATKFGSDLLRMVTASAAT